jgi:MurNAc alpha-1-phosphate uridylyltransferase
MKAMILAAGRGERMRPLTDRLPKPMLQVGGKALIAWQIERVAAAGITDFVINHSYLGNRIEENLGDGRQFGVRITYSREAEPLDIAGGVANALQLLGDEPFLLVSGDVYADYPYSRLAAIARDMREDARLAHVVFVDTQPPPPYDFGLDDDGAVVRSGGPGLTYAGMGAFRRELFAEVGRNTKAAWLPLLLRGVAERKLTGEVFAGEFANLTTPADLQDLDWRLQR